MALARGSSAITATGDDHALAWIYHLDGGSAQFRELATVWRGLEDSLPVLASTTLGDSVAS